MRYGLKLKLCREKMGFTQEEVAKRVGINRGTLSNYENNVTPVPITVFVQLAEIYKCDVFDIMGVHEGNKKEQIKSDADPYYLIKAHARYLVTNEKKANEMFGNEYSEEYYNSRFREKIKDMINNPIYAENFKN